MVIHDMRNPTNSIEYALKEVLKVLQTEGRFEVGDPSRDNGRTPMRVHPVLGTSSDQN